MRHTVVFALFVSIAAGNTSAQVESAGTQRYRQSREDAWWTGPILAPSAGTLPTGHFLVEPYVYDVISQGRYDADGRREPVERTHTFVSSTYVQYGVTDRITAGVIPRFGFNDVSNGPDSSGVGVGDVSLLAQYRFTEYREGSRVPTMSVVLGQTLPTGRYDRLGARPSDGLGSGAHTTTLSVYSQYFLWAPNGRIVRTRLNLSYSYSGSAQLEGVSVYGTSEGFRGHAKPGRSFVVDSAWEYSATRRWVLALDVAYQHDSSTRIDGLDSPASGGNGPSTPVRVNSGSRETLSLAPAVEYNWSSTMGVIAGVVFTASGRNAGANVIPVVAVNMVF